MIVRRTKRRRSQQLFPREIALEIKQLPRRQRRQTTDRKDAQI
jgi:hypothetical protein